MANQERFMTWLETHTQLSSKSVAKYASALRVVSSELEHYGLENRDLYTVTETAFIDRILANPEFQTKDTKGHQMYSVALNHLKRYVADLDSGELQIALFQEEMDFDKYLHESKASTIKKNITDTPQEKSSPQIVNDHRIWRRNPKYASEALTEANYLCEFDNEHKHFVSKYSKRNYVEAHHLIPMQFQNEFAYSLDNYANIVSICMVCHKKIHYGFFDDKKDILDKLFDARRDRLRQSGISITRRKLYSYYQD